MSVWDAFLLYLMVKNVSTALPREVSFSLTLSCLCKTLTPTRANLVGQGLILSSKQVSTLLLTTLQPKFISNPKSCWLRPFSPSVWDVTWHYLHLTAGFLSSFGLLAWRHSRTTRDLTSPIPSLGYLVSYFSYWYRVSLPWKTGTAGNVDLILSGFYPDKWW